MHSHVAKTVKYNFGHFSLVKSQYLLEPCVPRVQFIVMGISDEQRPRTTMVQSRIGDALKNNNYYYYQLILLTTIIIIIIIIINYYYHY